MIGRDRPVQPGDRRRDRPDPRIARVARLEHGQGQDDDQQRAATPPQPPHRAARQQRGGQQPEQRQPVGLTECVQRRDPDEPGVGHQGGDPDAVPAQGQRGVRADGHAALAVLHDHDHELWAGHHQRDGHHEAGQGGVRPRVIPDQPVGHHRRADQRHHECRFLVDEHAGADHQPGDDRLAGPGRRLIAVNGARTATRGPGGAGHSGGSRRRNGGPGAPGRDGSHRQLRLPHPERVSRWPGRRLKVDAGRPARRTRPGGRHQADGPPGRAGADGFSVPQGTAGWR